MPGSHDCMHVRPRGPLFVSVKSLRFQLFWILCWLSSIKVASIRFQSICSLQM
ncbi:hypothetical protein GW17_00007998 [Ensete ventricosum]|nr:hypothetical protein GW17_00007998 [Ensete ventricosum]